MIREMEERPPYVQFEPRTIENRDASIKEGRYIAKDVNYVIVTAAGSKDTVERIADEWLADIERKASSSPPRFNPVHARHFKAMYEAFKEGNELPEVGTPIKGWAVISPAEQENIIRANVRTVEDLASINDAGMMRIGMGAMALKTKAMAWLDSANDHGKVSAQVSALKVKSEEQERRIDELMAANRALMEKLGSTSIEPRQKRPYNRKPKEDAA